MTTTTVTDRTPRPAPWPITGEQRPSRVAAVLQHWTAARRTRRHLADKQRYDARDRSDSYIDRPGGDFRQDFLIAFARR